MDRTYVRAVHKDPDSDYGVSFPDLPGCPTVGSTFAEAREMTREVFALYMESVAADGDQIPPPGTADQALVHEDALDAIALIVVEALPERTEEEAQEEFAAFLASDEYQEIYGHPLTEDELDGLPDYRESISEAIAYGIGLRPVTDAGAKLIYAAVVHEDPGRIFIVIFPDLPGCFAAGSVLEEACKSARPALGCHLENVASEGASIPDRRSASDVQAHPAAAAIALIVVEALAERIEEEAQAACDAFMAAELGQEYMRDTAPDSEPVTTQSHGEIYGERAAVQG